MELRKPEDEDIRFFVKWANKPHAVQWFPHPSHWVVEMEYRYDEFAFVKHFIVTEEEKPIGFV